MEQRDGIDGECIKSVQQPNILVCGAILIENVLKSDGKWGDI